MDTKQSKAFEDGYVQGMCDALKAVEQYACKIPLNSEAKIAETLTIAKSKARIQYGQEDKK